MKRVILFAFVMVCFVSAAFAQKAKPVSNQAAVQKTLLALEAENDRATVAGDRASLDRLYADDFSGVDASGGKSTKKQILDFFALDGSVVAINETDETTIRVIGNTAIVTARLKYQNNERVEDQSIQWMRYTRIYTLRGKKWLVIAEHYCFISEDEEDNSAAQN